MNRCLPLASLDPFLSVALEAERVHDEAGGVQHIPSLVKASSVGLSVGLLDGVAHGMLQCVVDGSSIHHLDGLSSTSTPLNCNKV